MLLEALLHGKPIVATRVGGIPEVLTGELARWLVQPGNAEALAVAQVKALLITVFEPSWLGLVLGMSQAFSASYRAERRLAVYRQVTRSHSSIEASMASGPDGRFGSRRAERTTEEVEPTVTLRDGRCSGVAARPPSRREHCDLSTAEECSRPDDLG
ncbi:MAG: glycosyltransferase family 4 protein [Nitrospirota bacterium]|nr:glycosyltransferase family 4 protein [Nitrospirota bacterium]